MSLKTEIIKDTEYVVIGTTDIFLKALKGLLISFSFLIISRFLDLVFGFFWLTEQNIFIFLILGLSLYSSFIKYRKFTYFYIIGWGVGIFLMVSFNFIDSSKALIYISIPIIILTFRKLILHY